MRVDKRWALVLLVVAVAALSLPGAAVNAPFDPFKKFKADYRVIPWATIVGEHAGDLLAWVERFHTWRRG